MTKRGPGQPRKITGHVARKIFLLAGYGLTDEQNAEVMGIHVDTIKEAKKNVEFSATIKRAKDSADLQVTNSLFKRATGFNYEEEVSTRNGIVRIRKYALPDVMACMYWLNNRQRRNWNQKPVEEVAGAAPQINALIQVFQGVNEKQVIEIRQGKNPVEALFGQDFIDEKKQIQNA